MPHFVAKRVKEREREFLLSERANRLLIDCVSVQTALSVRASLTGRLRLIAHQATARVMANCRNSSLPDLAYRHKVIKPNKADSVLVAFFYLICANHSINRCVSYGAHAARIQHPLWLNSSAVFSGSPFRCDHVLRCAQTDFLTLTANQSSRSKATNGES